MTVAFPRERDLDLSHRTRLPVSSRVFAGLVAFADSVSILLAGGVLYVCLIGYSAESVGIYGCATAFIWLVTVLLFQFTGLYEFEVLLRPRAYLEKILVAFGTSFLLLLAAAFSLKVSATFSRTWICSFAAVAVVATTTFRWAAERAAIKLSARKIFTRSVVIAGSLKQVSHLLDHLNRTRPPFISIVGVFVSESADVTRPISGFRQTGPFDTLVAFARVNGVDDIIVASPWDAPDKTLSIIERLRELPVNVYLSEDIVGFRLDLRSPPSHFATLPIHEVIGRPLSGWGVAFKAVEDYALGFTALAVLLPVMTMIAIAIRVSSAGPVIFRQKRIGFNNQVFEIYKFRTMRVDRTDDGQTVQATVQDPRVTPLGRFLRRTSLDELPQLINVMKGTMSLVGPRPHALEHNHAFSQQIRGYFARHRVKPGITGWAQVNGLRGVTDTHAKLEGRVRCDVFYAENWSVLFDLRIIIRTIFVVMTGKNAY